MSPRSATTATFFANGAVIGTFVAHIPAIQQRFDLSSSAVGLTLIGMSVAVILTLPLAGEAVARHGSRRVTRAGGFACAVAVNLFVLAPERALVVAGMAVLGASSATMDVGMNSHGVGVERAAKRPLMSSLHAGWSVGAMTGAGAAALLAALGADPRLAVAIASAGLLALVAVTTARLGEGTPAAQTRGPVLALPPRGVVALALLCFLVMITEGSMADWGGIYLRRDLGAPAALAALAFAALTAGMTAGRLAGDRVNDRIGPVALLRAGALATALPLAAMLLIATPAAALAGLFVIGLGVANGVPLMFSAAGRRPGVPEGPAIAAVSTMGSLGFLAGPPFIGFLADATSLPWALSTLVAATAVVFALARAVAQ